MNCDVLPDADDTATATGELEKLTGVPSFTLPAILYCPVPVPLYVKDIYHVEGDGIKLCDVGASSLMLPVLPLKVAVEPVHVTLKGSARSAHV